MIHFLSAAGDSLRMAFFMFWETLWALILGFTLSGAVQAFVSRSEMERAMGGAGPGPILRATLFGMASSSCSYAATAMAKSLFAKGANFVAAITFMFASTNLVIELGIVLWILLGPQFTASEFAGGLIMIALFALLARFVFRPRLIETARQRLQREGDGESHGHSSDMAEQSLRARLLSMAGWADAAGYTVADLRMLRNEMIIGYLVAGILAVVVPVSIWNAVFLTGHGFWTSLENAIVGPFIAVISFVCSIGNVPLAAALWKGGISFGGVISFIFADLITFPLVLIYRKYYGWGLTLRLVALSWLVMSAAGLNVEYLFLGLHLAPAHGSVRIVEPSLQMNYTTVLNLLFLAVFGFILRLHRHGARFGAGQGYATDPVCGMQVQTANSPARETYADRQYYFCSDHCRHRFREAPDRFAAPAMPSAEVSQAQRSSISGVHGQH